VIAKTASAATNQPTTIYLYGDVLEIGAGLNSDDAALTDIKGFILLEKIGQ
jgi:hypothetical protein